MIVTLDVFSGKPNPTWTLSDADAKSFLERVANKTVAAAEDTNNVLGFRGFVLSATADTQVPDGIPADFRIGGSSTAGVSAATAKRPALSAAESDDALQWLLSTGQAVLDEPVIAHVTESIQRRNLAQIDPALAKVDQEIIQQLRHSGCIVRDPSYNPGFWNVPSVQPYNNCYNFAMNYRSNTFAQPGRQSGHPFTVTDCPNVSTAAEWDGNKLVCMGPTKSVALVIWPNVDFHWYARQAQGFWAHKPGGTPAHNTDNSGRLIDGKILTPANCNRGPYTVFCRYLFSPVGIVVS